MMLIVQQVTLTYISPFKGMGGIASAFLSAIAPMLAIAVTFLMFFAVLTAFLSRVAGGRRKNRAPIGLFLFLAIGGLVYIWTQAADGNYVPLVILGAIVAVAVWIARNAPHPPARLADEDSAQYKGRVGEAYVQAALQGLNSRMFVARHNLIMPGRQGTTEIDSVVFSYSGVFVIETKNWGGAIYGKENDWRWTVVYPNGDKEKPLNPLRQNELHVESLRKITNLPRNAFHSIAVVSGNNKFPKGMPNDVIRPDQLRSRILAERDVIFSGDEFDEIMAKVDAAADNSPDAAQRHAEFIQTRY